MVNHYVLLEGDRRGAGPWVTLSRHTQVASDGTISNSGSMWDGKPPPWVTRISRVRGPTGQEVADVLWSRHDLQEAV